MKSYPCSTCTHFPEGGDWGVWRCPASEKTTALAPTSRATTTKAPNPTNHLFHLRVELECDATRAFDLFSLPTSLSVSRVCISRCSFRCKKSLVSPARLPCCRNTNSSHPSRLPLLSIQITKQT